MIMMIMSSLSPTVLLAEQEYNPESSLFTPYRNNDDQIMNMAGDHMRIMRKTVMVTVMMLLMLLMMVVVMMMVTCIARESPESTRPLSKSCRTSFPCKIVHFTSSIVNNSNLKEKHPFQPSIYLWRFSLSDWCGVVVKLISWTIPELKFDSKLLIRRKFDPHVAS